MKCNVGKIDRIIRITIAITLITIGIMAQNYILAAVGLIPLLTAFIGFCPLYALIGLNTGCKISKD